MRLHNELVILDLEATSNQETKEVRPKEQTNNFIIEIGAVFVNRELKLVSQFDSIVQPEEPVTPFIAELTHISQEMVNGAQKWDVVAAKFEEWVTSKCNNIKNVRLCAFGNYFDMNLLRKMYKHYGRPFPFSGSMFDIKTVCFQWASLSGHRTDDLSVDVIAKLLGIVPEGQYHRALVDAVTTAKIFLEIQRLLSGGFYIPNNKGKPYQYIQIDPLD